MKESFVFYKSFYSAINELPNEYKLEVLEAIMEYNFNGIIPELTPVAKAMFLLMKPNIDNATQRYEASVENGKKGGAPKGNSNAKKQPKTTKKQPKNNLKQPSNNLNVYVNDNVNDNDNVVVNNNNVMAFYLNNINSTPVEREIETIEDYAKEMPPDLMIYGMEKAVDKKQRNLAYIKGIWNSWLSKGITTLSEAKDERPKRQEDVSNKFFDKNDQYSNITDLYAN